MFIETTNNASARGAWCYSQSILVYRNDSFGLTWLSCCLCCCVTTLRVAVLLSLTSYKKGKAYESEAMPRISYGFLCCPKLHEMYTRSLYFPRRFFWLYSSQAHGRKVRLTNDYPGMQSINLHMISGPKTFTIKLLSSGQWFSIDYTYNWKAIWPCRYGKLYDCYGKLYDLAAMVSLMTLCLIPIHNK